MTISANFPSIRPSLLLDFANTEQLDPRITFSRPTTASYYDNHTTVVAEQNLLQYSQDFDNAYWFKNGGTITANIVVSPDGTTTAETLTASAGTAIAPRFYPATAITGTSGISYTASIYAKAGTHSYLQIYMASGTSFCDFDLTVGTVGSSASCTPSITSVGSGWYRCVVTWTPASTDIRFIPTLVSSSTATYLQTWNPAGTETVYLWGAQLEQRSSVTAYTATTTAPITNYIPVLLTQQSNEARFDHNPTTRESLGLLIEEQRTNLLTYSSDFSNAAWTKSNATITATATIAPDGTQTAQKLVESTATGEHYVLYNAIPLVSGARNTITIYAKAGERSYTTCYIANKDGASIRIRFNLTDGVSTVITSNANLTVNTSVSVGNGWWRLSFTIDGGTGAGNPQLVWETDTGTLFSYTGNGYSGIFIWGAQLEAGSFATSYIPTVASQVTRSADSASMTGSNFSSWYNNQQGTIYWQGNFAAASPRLFEIGDGSDNNRINIRYSAGQNQGFVYVNNALQAQIYDATVASNTSPKLAFSYQTNNFGIRGNGGASAGAIANTTSGNLPVTNTLYIGSAWNGSYISGCIKKFAYYPISSTNAQLQSLTG
jgi:hypothetical protein